MDLFMINYISETITCEKCKHFIQLNNDAPKCGKFSSFYVCRYDTCSYATKKD